MPSQRNSMHTVSARQQVGQGASFKGCAVDADTNAALSMLAQQLDPKHYGRRRRLHWESRKVATWGGNPQHASFPHTRKHKLRNTNTLKNGRHRKFATPRGASKHSRNKREQRTEAFMASMKWEIQQQILHAGNVIVTRTEVLAARC